MRRRGFLILLGSAVAVCPRANLRTARELEIDVPQSLAIRADELIR
jgi:hypothetical protein